MSPSDTTTTARKAFGFAIGALLATLVGFWPRPTEADDTDAALEDGLAISQDEARSGAVEATSKLLRDTRDPSKWYLEVRFVNRNAEQAETAQFEERIQRTTYQPSMARAEPTPVAVWKVKDQVALSPGQESVVKHPLPKSLCAQLTNHARREEQAAKSEKARPGPVVSYWTSVAGTGAREQPLPAPAAVAQSPLVPPKYVRAALNTRQ